MKRMFFSFQSITSLRTIRRMLCGSLHLLGRLPRFFAVQSIETGTQWGCVLMSWFFQVTDLFLL